MMGYSACGKSHTAKHIVLSLINLGVPINFIHHLQRDDFIWDMGCSLLGGTRESINYNVAYQKIEDVHSEGKEIKKNGLSIKQKISEKMKMTAGNLIRVAQKIS